MASTDVSSNTSTRLPEVGTIDMKLEVVTLPVSDVDRAKRFYQRLGWRTDAEKTHAPHNWWDWHAAYMDERERGARPTRHRKPRVATRRKSCTLRRYERKE